MQVFIVNLIYTLLSLITVLTVYLAAVDVNSTVSSQNVPSDLPKRPMFSESKRPKYIFTIYNQTSDSKHFL